jgi:glyoxylase-like metal-dependent hydrolase (beta-lactamase superfamily II)
MLRRVLIGLGLVVVVVLGFVGYQLYGLLRSETVKIDDHFYVVLGGGGNTAILIGDAGVLVVDPKFLLPGRKLAKTISSIADKPVQVIINTHYHSDHTHGNANYPPGTDIIAQRRTRAHLLQLDGDFWQMEPAWSALPNDLVDDEKQFQFGDETVRVIYPGRGHTDGDVVVYFTKHRILHTGDFFLHDLYPFIDLRGGGSVPQWVSSLDTVLALRDVQRYIPGHGPISTRADVERFQSYLRTLVSQVEERVGRGESLSAIQSGIDLRGYDDFRDIPFFTSRAKNVRWVYEEAAGPPAGGPPGRGPLAR